MIKKIDTSYQEGNSKSNPEKLEVLSFEINKKLNELSNHLNQLNNIFINDTKSINRLKDLLITDKTINSKIHELDKNNQQIKNSLKSIMINLNTSKDNFDVFNNYYKNNYLQTISRLNKK